MNTENKKLGRGLGALLPSGKNKEDKSFKFINVSEIQANLNQPRKNFKKDDLEELALSIKSQGILQPIVVRLLSSNNYKIIAGERRWRAAQLAGIHEIPAFIKEIPEDLLNEAALIENIQRENLNPMEEANALFRLREEFEMTHQQTAEAVGKSRATVTHLLRLRNLNEDVKRMLENGDIEMGHARCLLALEGEVQSDAARLAVAKALTVRETEKLVRSILEPAPAKEVIEKDPDVKQLEQQLADNLGAKVEINYNKKGKGKLVISYTNLDELDGILNRINQDYSHH